MDMKGALTQHKKSFLLPGMKLRWRREQTLKQPLCKFLGTFCNQWRQDYTDLLQ